MTSVVLINSVVYDHTATRNVRVLLAFASAARIKNTV